MIPSILIEVKQLDKAILSEDLLKLTTANQSANKFILEHIEKPEIVNVYNEETTTTANTNTSEYKSSNLPEKQTQFIEAIKLAKSKKSKDDFEMGTILYERDKNLSKILGKSGAVENWIGIVKKKGANEHGKGELDITIKSKNNKGKIKTDFEISNVGIFYFNPSTFETSDGLIEAGTDLYDQMKIINEGDKITFSGNFLYERDYLEGKSKTDIFMTQTFWSKTYQLKKPVFSFEFTNLKRY